MKKKAIVCEKLKFLYVNVPKCACTSLKLWIYKIEFGEEFARYKKDNKWIHIHKCGRLNQIILDKLPEDKKDYKILTVIRDPIKRLISAYSNRVIHHNELGENTTYSDDIKAAGLKFDPDINYFIKNLQEYGKKSKSILHHTKPIAKTIGKNLKLYTNIYPIEKIARIKEDILLDSNLTIDSLPEIPKSQTGGPKLKLNILKPESFEKLVDYYAEDYELLRDYYPLEQIKEKYRASLNS
ncbi:MAG: sulfotransferase family 2 domain-containing protein [Pleurocapsa sp. MO_226.B13]|nr:sulfotransferase family 2 domain-containing protein [Pleurocapsa sp. MO_226.B13]